MLKIDPIEALKYGLVGFGLLLAYLAYRLLRKEQSNERSRPDLVRAIAWYMVFSFGLCVLGLLSELLIPRECGVATATLETLSRSVSDLMETDRNEVRDLRSKSAHLRADAALKWGKDQEGWHGLDDEANKLDARIDKEEDRLEELLGHVVQAINAARTVCKPRWPTG